MAFGPDGYLYISTGDAASGDRGAPGDPNGYAQNLQSPFGKMLRIDVNAAFPYAIPPDNPYADPADGVADELYALGLRNPWRWSFDRESGDLWLADIGQDGWEELNYLPLGAQAPQNYGWPCLEGIHPYLTTGCSSPASFLRPLLDYPSYSNNGHQSASITGGFVYRGSRYAALQGWYIYGDYAQGTIWTLKRDTGMGSYQQQQQQVRVADLVSFGEGTDGELYALSFQAGLLYQIGASDPSAPITSLQTGDWYDPASWSCGCVPTASNAVLIGRGHRIRLGQSAAVRSLVLQGSLEFTGSGALVYP